MVAEEPEVIHIGDDRSLDAVLDSIGMNEVVIERKGVRYRVLRESLEIADEDDPFAGYDPERARAATLKAAGKWQGIDTEALKTMLYEAREAGSRKIDKS